jgi:hypothetical protein
MRAAARVLQCGDVREKLRALQALQDAIDGAKSELLVELDASKDYELDGASTLNAWLRTQLRMGTRQASVLVKNATALRDLPLVAETAMAGKVSAAHVQVFAYGLKHVGLGPMREFEEAFVQVALDHEPAALFEAVKHLKDVVHPDDLDAKWLEGMDKEDFQINAVPDGWHVTGFLSTVTGAKLKKVIDALSAPHDKDDTRVGSQRRVQAIGDLCDTVLQHGLPSDKGIRPQLSVIVNADTLVAAANQVEQTTNPVADPIPTPEVEPATLVGHGHIGPNLLNYFLCTSDLTGFVMTQGDGHRQAQILNVGTTRKNPSLKQRKAVLVRQGGVCATPGCNHTHLEIHHTIWWSLGGPTNLDLLVGLCVRCHHLLHRGLLSITGNAVDGFEFTIKTGRSLHRRRQTSYHQAA